MGQGRFRTRRGCCGQTPTDCSICNYTHDDTGAGFIGTLNCDTQYEACAGRQLIANLEIDFLSVWYNEVRVEGGWTGQKISIDDGVYTFTWNTTCKYEATVNVHIDPDGDNTPSTRTIYARSPSGNQASKWRVLVDQFVDPITGGGLGIGSVGAEGSAPQITLQTLHGQECNGDVLVDAFGAEWNCTGLDCMLRKGNVSLTEYQAIGADGNTHPGIQVDGHLILRPGVIETMSGGLSIGTGLGDTCGFTTSSSGIGSVKRYPNGILLTGGDGVTAGSGKLTSSTFTGNETGRIDVIAQVGPGDYLEFVLNSPTDATNVKAILDMRSGTYLGEAYDIDFGFTEIDGTAVAAADRVRVETQTNDLVSLTISFCLIEENKAVMRINAAGFTQRCMETVYGRHKTDRKLSIEAIEGSVLVFGTSIAKDGSTHAECGRCNDCGDSHSIDPDCVVCSGLNCTWTTIDGVWSTEGGAFSPESEDPATILTDDTAGGPYSRMFRFDIYLPKNSFADVNAVLGWNSSTQYMFVKFWENGGCIWMRLGYVNTTATYEDTSYLIGCSDGQPFTVELTRDSSGLTDVLYAHVPKYNAYVSWNTGVDLFASSGGDRFGWRVVDGGPRLGAPVMTNAYVLNIYVDDDATTWDCPQVLSESMCQTTNDCCEECIRGTWPAYVDVVIPGAVQILPASPDPEDCVFGGGMQKCTDYVGGTYRLSPLDTEGNQADMCTYELITSDSLCGETITVRLTLFYEDATLLEVETDIGLNYIDYDTTISTHAGPVNCRCWISGCGGGYTEKNNVLTYDNGVKCQIAAPTVLVPEPAP